MQIPVTISVPSKRIAGMFHIPNNRRPDSPVVIMCYGMNGNRVENHRLSYNLAIQAEREGLIFFRFDYSGLGISQGEYSQMTLQTKVDDLILCMEFIQGCIQNTSLSFVLIGYSDGAKVAVEALHKSKFKIDLCFWNPVLYDFPIELLETSSEQKSSTNFKLNLVRDPVTKKLSYPLPFTGLLMHMEYLKSLSDDSFNMTNLLNSKCKKIFIFGSNDIKSKKTEDKYRLLKNDFDNNMLVTIKKCDHLFSTVESSREVIEKTISWIKGELT